MGSIENMKPLSSVPNSAVNKHQQLLRNAENQTHGCWVRNKYAASVLCSPPGRFKLEWNLEINQSGAIFGEAVTALALTADWSSQFNGLGHISLICKCPKQLNFKRLQTN